MKNDSPYGSFELTEENTFLGNPLKYDGWAADNEGAAYWQTLLDHFLPEPKQYAQTGHLGKARLIFTTDRHVYRVLVHDNARNGDPISGLQYVGREPNP